MLSFFKPAHLKFQLIDILRGTTISTTLTELRKQQYLPGKELQTIREEKLNRLFNIAKTSTAYYRDFETYEELPVLTKEMIRKHHSKFLSTAHKQKLIKKATGGSTGSPFDYFTTKFSLSYMWAGILLCWEEAGYKPGDKVAFLAGSSLYKSGWQHKLFYNFLNIDVLPASPLSDEVMKAYAEKIRKGKATILYGYSYALNTMAVYLNRLPKQHFPHLKGVVSTAELLSDVARKNIQQAFGVPVYNQYGCNEAGVSAFECRHQKMHLISTRSFYETDENGTLLSTDLSNEAFIMMKYNTTDIVELSDVPCECKRNFPVISKLLGRLNDVVVDMEGQVLHASFFGIALSKDTTIQQYQVTFTNNSLNLNVHSQAFEKDYFYKKYIPVISKHAKFEHYSVTINAPFEKTPNGKHREVVDKRKVRAQMYAV